MISVDISVDRVATDNMISTDASTDISTDITIEAPQKMHDKSYLMTGRPKRAKNIYWNSTDNFRFSRGPNSKVTRQVFPGFFIVTQWNIRKNVP